MKKKLLFSLFALMALSAAAQYTSTEYWSNGKKKSEGQYTSNPGILASDSKEIIAQKQATVTKIGSWTYWNENGTTYAQEEYTSSGTVTGTWKTWYANGQVATTINFATGSATYWYENGTKSSEGTVNTSMVQTGRWVGWHDNGNKNFEGSYSATGQQQGTWTYWASDGRKLTEQTWNNGVLVSTKNFSE